MGNILIVLFSGVSLLFFLFFGLIIRQIHVTRGINRHVSVVAFFALGISFLFFLLSWAALLSFVFSS